MWARFPVRVWGWSSSRSPSNYTVAPSRWRAWLDKERHSPSASPSPRRKEIIVSKVLVIEDETILRVEIAEWLTFEGYEVISAEDGMAGVETALHQPPDLIICDITMPRLDGYGVLREVRSNRTRATTQFIFRTARAAHEDIRKGMGLGADDYVTKPFTRLELLQAVHARVEKKVAQEEKHQREIDQLEQALALEHQDSMFRSKLVAMFSHDFRNPLASIMAANSFLRAYSDRLDEQRRLAHFDRIEASVRQLVQMLEDMLIVAQMEMGNLVSEAKPLNVEQFIGSIVQEFQAIARESHQLRFDSTFSSTVLADTRLLRQIAANLISNAIKYSPPGTSVHIMLDSDDGQYILSVQDHG